MPRGDGSRITPNLARFNAARGPFLNSVPPEQFAARRLLGGVRVQPESPTTAHVRARSANESNQTLPPARGCTMNQRRQITIDGNEAAAHVAYRASEVIAIYPITPSSGMGEMSDAWSATGRRTSGARSRTWSRMQSEGGASGAVHGAAANRRADHHLHRVAGPAADDPNMFKMAGELTPTVFHVSARTVATHALSIFGDHSDVMACRATGFAMLASGSVQEVDGHGADRPRGLARIALAVHSLLRRLPHLARRSKIESS
jgi:hypothetical protein